MTAEYFCKIKKYKTVLASTLCMYIYAHLSSGHVQNIYIHNLSRAWQRKLHSVVKNDESQAQMYASLSMLISEQDVATFLTNQEIFISYWQDREPEFTQYYQKEYSNRAGMVGIRQTINLKQVLTPFREVGS